MGAKDDSSATPLQSVAETLTRRFDRFSPAERKVASKVLEDPSGIIGLNVSQMAELCHVSDATVVRMSQHAGYSGYYQMRIILMSDLKIRSEGEGAHAPTDPVSYSFEKNLIYLKLLCTDAAVSSIERAADMILAARAVYVAAIGNSAPLADDLEFRLNTLGIRAFTGSRIETKMRHISNACSDDVLVMISRSGASTSLLKLADLAGERGMKIISITGDGISPLSKRSSIVIPSGNPAKAFAPIEPRVQSHLGEFLLMDALVFQIDLRMRAQGDRASGDDLDFLLSEFKL